MPDRLKPIARKLRTDATSAERRLWSGLRREQIEGFKFRRQVILNGFVADFACLEARLVLEVDGATHSTHAEVARDAARSAALVEHGYAILRFTNDEVFHNFEGVLETIRLKLIELRPRLTVETFEDRATPLPNPPPQWGGNSAAVPSPLVGEG
jgi:very-short-patch-repair endonuclease